MSKGTRMILVIDMLKGFHDTGVLANPRVAKIIPNIKNLLDRSVECEDAIVFLCDSHESDDPEFKMFPPHCVKGTIEAEVIDELQRFIRFGAFIVHKKTYSGFYRTNLDWFLEYVLPKKPNMVIVVGVCTDICVLHTVAELRNRGYTTVVPLDCVETFDAPGHPAEETAHWAIRHMENVLGAVMVPDQKSLG